MIVLDTSALIYWTLDPGQLSQVVKQAIDQAEKLIVSSISIWEISIKVERGKLEIPLPIPEYANRLQRLEKLNVLAVDVQDWLDNLALEWDHPDPADRTIVAKAIKLACPLVTSDRLIANFYKETIW